MYWWPGQFEGLRGLSKEERDRILAAALEGDDPDGKPWSVYLAFGVMVGWWC
jgi:hypothetical protein